MYYNLFISHSWTYSNAYENLIKLLDSVDNFYYKNYSIPQYDPIHNAKNASQLRQAIYNQIKYASCVLVLAGVYSTYSKWIKIEIELAKKLGKKIIAVQPWGAERTSAFVKNNADVIVKWQGASIVKAIKGF